uniref:hypothetical protein n=1 Tax=uncultured Allobacillus sp. TaxID=1638025 RepID=UPI002591B395|nr:hypothetical protein [uncultured Allobacillus sp.]
MWLSLRLHLIDESYIFNIKDFTNNSTQDNNMFSRESTLELSLLYQLSIKESGTYEIFGDWDYLSHQVIASPFKPIQWVDKMDIFGYRYVKGFYPTVSKYLVAELKREEAILEDIDQLLKYVDWINSEYSLGDYSMIKAYLVASEFSQEVIDYTRDVGKRFYTTILRDDRTSEIWDDITLVKYKYDTYKERTHFEVIK